jgi:hypothetical protein
VGVQADDTGLITNVEVSQEQSRYSRCSDSRLGNVSEDAVDHSYEHTVLQGVASVLCEIY